MTYVEDLVTGVMLATESPMVGQTYNLGRSSAVSMIEVLQELGYAPKVGPTEGLARQVEWQRGQLTV
jgi:nucleoside-diphosphate-sugar epimerase